MLKEKQLEERQFFPVTSNQFAGTSCSCVPLSCDFEDSGGFFSSSFGWKIHQPWLQIAPPKSSSRPPKLRQVSFSNNFATLFFLPGPNCPEVWLLFLAGFLVDVGNPKAPLSHKQRWAEPSIESEEAFQNWLPNTQTTNCLENSRFFWKKHYPKRITMICRNHLNTDSFFVPSWYGFQKCHPQQWWSPLSSVVMTLQTKGRKTASLVGMVWVLPKHWKNQLILVRSNRGSPS